MRTRIGSLISVFCLSLVPGFAQQNAPAAHRPMTLDVVVTDKQGKPVSGLQQADFTLLDNKQPQKILSFQAIGGPATEPPPAEVILLIDNVNAAFSQVASERDQIVKFLGRNDGHLAHPVSLVFFSDTETTIGTAPTQDGNALIADLNQKWIGLRTINRAQGVSGANDQFQLSLRALDELIAHEAPRPGRKLVLWISPGWPLLSGPGTLLTDKQTQWLFANIVHISDGLQRAGITLYAIDPLGMSDAGAFRTFVYQDFLKPVKIAGLAQAGNLALQVLAMQSGGRVINSVNDISGEIAECAADADAYYMLSFEAAAVGNARDNYHALDIKLDKPGWTARTRAGYYTQVDSPRP